jgi:hypothetical protein
MMWRVTGWDEEGRFAWREDVDGVRQALAELLALSRSDLILHSFGSSFGEEAAGILFFHAWDDTSDDSLSR